MLSLLMVLLTFFSFIIMLFKRNKETFYIFMLCLTLAIFILAELMYIAKKGGISSSVEIFYYLTNDVRLMFQYFEILLATLGFWLAIGRYLFPYFLMSLAVSYSAIPILRRKQWIKYVLIILPLVSIMLYHPNFFKAYIEPFPAIQEVVVTFSYTWPVGYCLAAIGLLIIEVLSVPIKYMQKYFISIVSFVVSLAVLYLLYVRQDPAQVYQFYYSLYEWKHGLHYINTILSIPLYIVYLVVIGLFGFLGLFSLTRYTHNLLTHERDKEIGGIELNSVSKANAVFVHSIKNDLLANQVALKRISNALVQEDIETALKYQQMLETNEEKILSKVNEMYRATRTSFTVLQKVKLSGVIEKAIERAKSHYPDAVISIEKKEALIVSADMHHLSEALYNIIVNGIEAAIEKNIAPIIQMKAYHNRLYIVIEVFDNGVGINKKELSKIFRPYISSKNTKSNYGIGLMYVNTVVQEHHGRIHVQSKVNVGTCFSILLPKSISSKGRNVND